MTLDLAVIWLSEHTFMYVDSALTHLCNTYVTFYGWGLTRQYSVSLGCFNIPPLTVFAKPNVLALVNHLGQWKGKFKHGIMDKLGRSGVSTVQTSGPMRSIVVWTLLGGVFYHLIQSSPACGPRNAKEEVSNSQRCWPERLVFHRFVHKDCCAVSYFGCVWRK